MKMVVDGAEIEYDHRGSGPAIVMLHAFPLSLSMWEPQTEILARTHRVASLDARGFGGSAPVEGVLTMERIADDAAAVMDALGIQEAIVLGCSMGGYAALAFARRHAHRLAGLVLQDTRAAGDSDAAKAARAALAARVQREGARAAVDALLPNLVGVTSKAERPELVAQLRELILAAPPASIAAALAGLAARSDSRPTLTTIRVATLVLVGEEDVLTPPAEARQMAEAIAGARIETIPQAGHLSNLENPTAFNQALGRFLAAPAAAP